MRLIRQELETFKGPGDKGFDLPENILGAMRRMDNTIQFIDKMNPEYRPDSFLDVAGPSIVGKKIADNYRSAYYTTSGDIDRDWQSDCEKVHTVLMLEVLEHILNPLKFFSELRDRVDFKAMIVSWPARPSWLWTNIHFHEMRLDRFEYLCKMAGYHITYTHKGTLPETWYNRFRGIRPFFRSFTNTHYITQITKK